MQIKSNVTFSSLKSCVWMQFSHVFQMSNDHFYYKPIKITYCLFWEVLKKVGF